MTTKELLRLPFNRQFILTDGIWEYTLIKQKTSTVGTVYQITDNELGRRFHLFEIKAERKYEDIKIGVFMLIGGLSAMGNLSYYNLNKLKIVSIFGLRDYMSKEFGK